MVKVTTREEFEKMDVFGIGAPNDAFSILLGIRF